MPQRLLAVYAHPDDEAFGTGGTLARYAAEGAQVTLICATRGESGKITDPAIHPDTDKGKLREAELSAACEALGVSAPIFLDYHDSGRHERVQHDNLKALMNVDELELEQALLSHISDLKPEIILTFDPHGIYGHIDHVKIHRAATAAFWLAGGVTEPAPKRLFYNAMASEQMQRLQTIREASPLAELDADLYGVSEASFAAVLDVTPYAAQKEAAIRAHRSQTGPQSSFAGLNEDTENDVWQEMFALETFTLGGLRGSFPEMPVADLFAGLV